MSGGILAGAGPAGPAQPGAHSGAPEQPKARGLDALAAALAEREAELLERIGDDLVERVARRVIELQRDGGQAGPLIDASEVARRVGRGRDWVYRHAAELGAVRLGDGARPRLGFDPAKVADYADACTSSRRTEPPSKRELKPRTPRRRARVNGQPPDFLPIRGKAPAP